MAINVNTMVETKKTVLADLFIGDCTDRANGTEISFERNGISYIVSGRLNEDGMFLFDISAYTSAGADYGTKSYKIEIFDISEEKTRYSLPKELIMLFVRVLEEEYPAVRLSQLGSGFSLPSLDNGMIKAFIWFGENFDVMSITRKQLQEGPSATDPFAL